MLSTQTKYDVFYVYLPVLFSNHFTFCFLFFTTDFGLPISLLFTCLSSKSVCLFCIFFKQSSCISKHL